MKKTILSAAAFAVVAFSAVAVAPAPSEAVPAFARQTGAACLSCHFQAIPRLSAFGRAFKLGGFRDMGEQALLEDDHLSLPAYFNGSLLFKARAMTTSGVAGGNFAGGTGSAGSKTGLQYPDEAAFLIGGRYGENFGGLTEWNGGPLSYKFGGFIDLDMGTLGIVAGSTDALGVGYLMNDPSNTLVRNTRGTQFRATFMRNTMMHNGASGVSAYLASDLFYVGLGWIISNGGTNPGNPAWAAFDSAQLVYRAALTTEIAGFDFVGGLYGSAGDQKKNGTLLGITKEQIFGVDAQLQGGLGELTLGLYFKHQFQGKVFGVGALPNSINPIVLGNHTGSMIVGQLAMGHIGARLGYQIYKDRFAVLGAETEKVIILGGWYSLAQNVELDLEFNHIKNNRGSGPVGGVFQDMTSTTLLLEYVY